MTTATHRAPGFRVTKTDGLTVFHDVPIFTECARGDLSFDQAWLLGALAEAKQAERDGYLPPLHTRHHEEATDYNNSVRAVGTFRITRAAPLTFKGKRVLALFADLLITDEYMADELARMKYPYRSVEIFDPEGPPKINGLALLDHEAPYLELPMLFAGEVEDKRDPYRQRREPSDGLDASMGLVANATSFTLNYRAEEGGPLLWSARAGQRAALLFRFPDEDTMTETTKTKPANFADDDEKEDEGENMEGEGGGNVVDVDAVCKAIEDGSISVEAMDRIIAAIQAQSAASEAPEEEAGDAGEGGPAQAPAPGAEIMRAGKGQDAVAFAQLQGRIAAMEAREEARAADDKRRTDVDAALKRLEGRVVGSDPRAKLEAFHKNCGGKAEVFRAYVDALAAGSAPAPDDEGSRANFAAQPSTPKAAMPWAGKGSVAFDKAIGFARQAEHSFPRKSAEWKESYVRNAMERAGFKLEEESAA